MKKGPVDFRPVSPSLDASLPETKRGIRLRGPLLTPDGRALHAQPTIDANDLPPEPVTETSEISIRVADYSLPPLEKIDLPYPSPIFAEESPIAMKHKPSNPGGDESVVFRSETERSVIRLSLFQDDTEFHDSLTRLTAFPDWKPLKNVGETIDEHFVFDKETLSVPKRPFAVFDRTNKKNDGDHGRRSGTKPDRLFDDEESSSPSDSLDRLSEEFDSLLETMPDMSTSAVTVTETPSMQLAAPPAPRRRRLVSSFRRQAPGFAKNKDDAPTKTLTLRATLEEIQPENPSVASPTSTLSLPSSPSQNAASERSLKVFEDSNPNVIPASTPGETFLVAESLTKSYYKGKLKIPVLKGVNFSVREGEFVSIVGQSGSGKSTLLHLLGTLDNPESGTIHFDGRRIDNLPMKRRDQLRNRSIGLIFQFYHLLPELTTLENVLSPLMIRETVFGYFFRRRQHIENAERFLEQVGLSHRLNHKPSELSGGEMQRAAIARALVSEPRILFADEPTGNLDAQSSREIIELLRRLNAEHRLTIVMVTHDSAIAKSADRMVRMVDGRIDETGPTLVY